MSCKHWDIYEEWCCSARSAWREGSPPTPPWHPVGLLSCLGVTKGKVSEKDAESAHLRLPAGCTHARGSWCQGLALGSLVKKGMPMCAHVCACMSVHACMFVCIAFCMCSQMCVSGLCAHLCVSVHELTNVSVHTCACLDFSYNWQAILSGLGPLHIPSVSQYIVFLRVYFSVCVYVFANF